MWPQPSPVVLGNVKHGLGSLTALKFFIRIKFQLQSSVLVWDSRTHQWINITQKLISHITKTRLYNVDPLKPHFYIIKLGFTGVYIIFLFLLKNIDFGYPLEPPHRGGSNEYQQSMFWTEIWKISEFFIWKLSFFGGKIFYIFEYIYFNRHVFVMNTMMKRRRAQQSPKKMQSTWQLLVEPQCATTNTRMYRQAQTV